MYMYVCVPRLKSPVTVMVKERYKGLGVQYIGGCVHIHMYAAKFRVIRFLTLRHERPPFIYTITCI